MRSSYRSFGARLAALEALELAAESADLTRYTDDERYRAAALLLDHYQIWDFGGDRGYAPHIASWKPNDAQRVRYAEACEQFGLNGWTYETIKALCRWLNSQDGAGAAVVRAGILWQRRLQRALVRLSDDDLQVLCDAAETPLAQAIEARVLALVEADTWDPDIDWP